MRLLAPGITAILFACALNTPAAQAPLPQAAPAVQTAEKVECVAVDFGAGKRGEPALLRNRCAFAVNAAVCFSNVTPGSTTEVIACEKARFKVLRIEAKGAAMIDQTDGERYHWRACQPPFVPRLWWNASLAGDDRSQGACER